MAWLVGQRAGREGVEQSEQQRQTNAEGGVSGRA